MNVLKEVYEGLSLLSIPILTGFVFGVGLLCFTSLVIKLVELFKRG